jgi:hypothetical protein
LSLAGWDALAQAKRLVVQLADPDGVAAM